MNIYIFLLAAIFFNGYTTLYAQTFKNNNPLLPTSQVKESIESLIDKTDSVSFHNTIATLNTNGITDIGIVFCCLLLLLIVLCVSFFVFKRCVNSTTRSNVNTNKKPTYMIDEMDSIFEIYPVGVWIISKEGALVDVNNKGLELMGVPDIDLIKGLPLKTSQILPEDVKEAFRKRKAIETTFLYSFSKVREIKYYKTSKDCEILRVNLKGKPIFNSSGEFEKYIFIIEDVTEIYNREQMLSESQLSLSLALDAGDIIVWEYDILSRCFSTLQGHTPEDSMNSYEDRLSLIHPDDIDEFKTVFNKVLKGEKLNATLSFRFIDTNINEYQYLKTDISPVFSKEGTITKIVGTRKNITDEVLNKQKVDEAILYMKLSVESMDTTIWYIEKGRLYIFKEDSFVDIGEVASLLNNMSPLNKKNYENLYNAALSDEYISDCKVLKVSDELTSDYNYFEYSYKTIKDSDGNVCRILGGHHDITQRMREEARIDNLRKGINLALGASNIIAWTESLRTGEVDAIYGSIKGLEIKEKKSWVENIHPKDIEKCTIYFNGIISGDIKDEPIFIYIKKGDVYGYAECTLSVYHNDEGEPTHLIGSLKDLTEINNLNESLTNLYDESQVILQSLPVGIAVYDKNGRQQYINDPFVEIFGIDDREEHLKKTICLFEDPVVPTDIKKRIQRGETFDEISEYDLKPVNDYYVSMYNHKLYLEGKARYVKDSNGNILKYILIVNDITEKYRAELILEDSERNLKLALEAGNVDAWLYDVKSKNFTPLGDHCSFGTTPFNLDYDNEIICPDDIAKRDAIMNDIIQGKIDKGQTVLRYKTNPRQDQYRYYDTRITAKKEDNVVVTLPFAQRDITDTYLHDIEKEYSQKKTKFAIDSAELALWEYDAIGHVFTSQNNDILDSNPAECLSVDEYCKYLNADESSDIEFRNIISCMNEGIDKSYSIDIKVKNEKDYEWTYYTIGYSAFEKDEYGRVIKYVGYIKDNTKWIALNETLVDLNTQLKIVLDIGNIFPFICDVKNDKFHFTTTSPIGRTNIFPIALNTELTLKQLLLAFNPEDIGDMEDVFAGLVNGDISEISTEVSWDSESQNASFYELNMSALRDEDFKGSLKLIGYLQDITERNQMISDLQEAKQGAETATKLKSAFLANMSHEIRTPLNAIVGFSELLIDEKDEKIKSEYLGIISTNNDLLLKLISDVLDLSKIDAGITEINVSVFDFAQFFNELYLSMQQKVDRTTVTLSVINLYSECIVELDKNRLAQVCINYITNAIKYTPKGSIDMGYESVNGGIRLYVKDTGIGIADNKKPKVFQRFEKLDDFAQGTGLGLSITKALVESMKGEVGFESEEGIGSTFWAWIPCNFKHSNDTNIVSNKDEKSV